MGLLAGSHTPRMLGVFRKPSICPLSGPHNSRFRFNAKVFPRKQSPDAALAIVRRAYDELRHVWTKCRRVPQVLRRSSLNPAPFRYVAIGFCDCRNDYTMGRLSLFPRRVYHVVRLCPVGVGAIELQSAANPLGTDTKLAHVGLP